MSSKYGYKFWEKLLEENNEFYTKSYEPNNNTLPLPSEGVVSDVISEEDYYEYS